MASRLSSLTEHRAGASSGVFVAATNRQLRETICERWSSVKAVAFLEANARSSSAALPRRSASVSFAQHSSINALVVLRSLAAARGVVWASARCADIAAACLHKMLSGCRLDFCDRSSLNDQNP